MTVLNVPAGVAGNGRGTLRNCMTRFMSECIRLSSFDILLSCRSVQFSIQEQPLPRNEKRFRGGLVLEAYRLVYHSTLGSRVIKKMKFLSECIRVSSFDILLSC